MVDKVFEESCLFIDGTLALALSEKLAVRSAWFELQMRASEITFNAFSRGTVSLNEAAESDCSQNI